MQQEAFTMSLLFDFYGELLSPKQRCYYDLYCNQDFSLSEIAEQEGISRQGVHDAITRAEALLRQMERQTGCVARLQALRSAARSITQEAESLMQHPDSTVRHSAQRILSAVSSVKE